MAYRKIKTWKCEKCGGKLSNNPVTEGHVGEYVTFNYQTKQQSRGHIKCPR